MTTATKLYDGWGRPLQLLVLEDSDGNPLIPRVDSSGNLLAAPSGTCLEHSEHPFGKGALTGTTVYSDEVTVDNYVFVQCSLTIDAAATSLTIGMTETASGDAYFDDLTFALPGSGAVHRLCNHNGELYVAKGGTVGKLNSGGDGFDIVGATPGNVTDVVSSIGSSLYIFCGDDQGYWIADGAGNMTPTSLQAFSCGTHHAGRLWGITADGVTLSSANPEAGDSASWSSGGTLDISIAGTLRHLGVHQDASGQAQLHAVTTRGLWRYNADDDTWRQTEVILPQDASSGLGFTLWRDAAMVSAGLDIYRHIAKGSTASANIGLNCDDGLPAEYDGAVAELVGGDDNLFALVDASQVSGSSTSAVYARGEQGWRCCWTSGSSNTAIQSAVISYDYAHRLWLSDASALYCLPLYGGVRKPKKISGYAYRSSGIHITPWFDARAAAHDKLALRLKLFCRDLSATETVTVKYRLDHEDTDRDSGWRELGLADSSGESVFGFGGGSGQVFKAIQFRFDLARDAADSSRSPEIIAYSLAYLKLLALTWAWSFEVDCGGDYGGLTSRQLETALLEACRRPELLPFTFRNATGDAELHYVKVHPLKGETPTGEHYAGRYQVTVIEP